MTREGDLALPLEKLPRISAGAGLGFLAGIRVLDLTTSIAGPYATMLLADFGAEVVKVERPAGDDARHWGPPFLEGEGLWFLSVNRNKKSIVLDVSHPDGRATLLDLARTADVVVSNQPASVQEKLGLTCEAFQEVREDLIFVSITGFGMTGERRDLTCYDLIAEGYSGIMDITGAADSAPQKLGAPAADMLAGQDAAMATLAALFDRQRTGKGRRIDIALSESMTRFLACRLSSYIGSGEVPKRSGGTDSVIAIYQSFETADQPITLGLGSDAIWRRFWAALGNTDYAERTEFDSNAKRRQHRAAIVADIQEILHAEPRSHWLQLFADARVPAGPINSLDTVATDQRFHERGFIGALEDDDGRLTPHIGLGIQVDGAPVMPRHAAPRLGEHTEGILARL
ncbi:MAG: CoA transferase [Pseudomonadota bacterium]